jgi:hypothetical protein
MRIPVRLRNAACAFADTFRGIHQPARSDSLVSHGADICAAILGWRTRPNFLGAGANGQATAHVTTVSVRGEGSPAPLIFFRCVGNRTLGHAFYVQHSRNDRPTPFRTPHGRPCECSAGEEAAQSGEEAAQREAALSCVAPAHGASEGTSSPHPPVIGE